MKTRYFLLSLVAMMWSLSAHSDETITVSSTSSDISEQLDLRAVANLFGEVANLETFEQELNSEERHISNLDLNGDGMVDYLRVVEMETGGKHLIIIQAVLAKDIYQDVASIYVEKDDANNVKVTVAGDAYIYGANYVIEPVYIYRPLIYDWFWGPNWVCWSSPWYWGYYPGWWYGGCCCWSRAVYCEHIYVYHYEHPRCTYRYARSESAEMAKMRTNSTLSRNDYAKANPQTSFSSRHAEMTNARGLDKARLASTNTSGLSASARPVSTGSVSANTTTTSTRNLDRLAGSTFTRASVANTAATTRSATSTTTASTVGSGTRSGASATSHSSATATTTRPHNTYTAANGSTSAASSGTRTSVSSTSSRSTATTSSTTYRPTTTTSRPSTGTYSGGSVGTYSGGRSSGSTYSGGGHSAPSGGGGHSGGNRH